MTVTELMGKLPIIVSSFKEQGTGETLHSNAIALQALFPTLDTLKVEVQKAYEAFSTQDFLAMPTPLNKLEPIVYRENLFDWEVSSLVRNVGKEFQLIQVPTLRLYIQYVLTGGFTNPNLPRTETSLILEEFADAKALLESLRELAK